MIFVACTFVCRRKSPQGLMFVSYSYSTLKKYSIYSIDTGRVVGSFTELSNDERGLRNNFTLL